MSRDYEIYDVTADMDKVKELLSEDIEFHIWKDLAPVSIFTKDPLPDKTKQRVVDIFPHPIRVYFGVPEIQ